MSKKECWVQVRRTKSVAVPKVRQEFRNKMRMSKSSGAKVCRSGIVAVSRVMMLGFASVGHQLLLHECVSLS